MHQLLMIGGYIDHAKYVSYTIFVCAQIPIKRTTTPEGKMRSSYDDTPRTRRVMYDV